MMNLNIHVEKACAEGKVWLGPVVKIAYMHGFNSKEQKVILGIVTVELLTFKQKWNEYFA